MQYPWLSHAGLLHNCNKVTVHENLSDLQHSLKAAEKLLMSLAEYNTDPQARTQSLREASDPSSAADT